MQETLKRKLRDREERHVVAQEEQTKEIGALKRQADAQNRRIRELVSDKEKQRAALRKRRTSSPPRSASWNSSARTARRDPARPTAISPRRRRVRDRPAAARRVQSGARARVRRADQGTRDRLRAGRQPQPARQSSVDAVRAEIARVRIRIGLHRLRRGRGRDSRTDRRRGAPRARTARGRGGAASHRGETRGCVSRTRGGGQGEGRVGSS